MAGLAIYILWCSSLACGDDEHPGTQVCGNGIVEEGEECDEGTSNSDTTPDACRTNCTLATCRNGVIDPGEDCDGTNLGGMTCEALGRPGGLLGCGNFCEFDLDFCERLPGCGNSYVEAGEGCDDGGTEDGDGCSATCQVEPGWVCLGWPNRCYRPSADALALTCAYENVGALREPRPDITVPCELRVASVDHVVLPLSGLEVTFMAEAGVLEAVIDPESQETVVQYRVTGGNAAPVDVDPMITEPSRTGPLGETFNPRDGVVSLLAITRGSEAFDDLNLNGVRDPDEPFMDLDEPFLDVDDDEVFTAGMDEFFDANGDGEWTPANGEYDLDTYLSVQTKIVWTGDLEEDLTAARLVTAPASTDLSNGGSLTLDVYLLDRHLNPLAAFTETGDFLELVVNGAVTVTPSSSLPLTNLIGMSFDHQGQGQFLWCDDDAGRFTVTVQDADPAVTTDPTAWSLSVSFTTTPGPTGATGWLDPVQAEFTQGIEGTVR
jgi:cysteine-rich repeat protein